MNKRDEYHEASYVTKPSFDPEIIAKQDENYPKISIVMPSYNQGQFIERSILTVLNQNYPNTELIIIDGGSEDETVDILKKYDDYISYWISEPDEGQSDALNKGFAQGTGDIYGWLNADDLYLDGTFQVAVDELVNSDYQVCMGDYLNIDTDDNILSYNYAFDFNVNHFIYEGFHCNAQSMFWTKELHSKFGSFDIDLHRTMDYDMILQFGLIAGNSAFKRIEKPLGAFRRHEQQKTQGGVGQSVVRKEHQRIAQKHDIRKYRYPYKLLYYFYRLRRAFWYTKRGGVSYMLKKIKL